MSAYVQQWDRFINRDPENDLDGHTVEVIEIKMGGYLYSSVGGPRATRKFVHRDGMPGPLWAPAPTPTDLDEAVRITVLNEIADSDCDEDDPGTWLSTIVDLIEQRLMRATALAYVSSLLASIGASERDGVWTVATLPPGWAWEQSPSGGAWLTHRDEGQIAIVDSACHWTIRCRGTAEAPTHGSAVSLDAAVTRAEFECRRRGLFAEVKP